MGEVTKADIVARLIEDGTPRHRAAFYADAYLEYREATRNIEEHGIIVAHPRTANPIENPYLVIRDRAAKKLADMRGVKADWLW